MGNKRYETLEIELSEDDATVLGFILRHQVGQVDIKLVRKTLKVHVTLDESVVKQLKAKNCNVLRGSELTSIELLRKLKDEELDEFEAANRRINLLYDASVAKEKLIKGCDYFSRLEGL